MEESTSLEGLLLWLLFVIVGYFGHRMSMSRDEHTAAEGRRVSELTAKVFVVLFTATVATSLIFLVIALIRVVM